jgi:ATP-dependent RNA helicase DDX24/MAK5
VEDEIPQMNIELYMLDKLKVRVQLARQIDVAQHRAKKEKHERNWLKETADAMEIELDSDFADRCARPRLACLPVFELRWPHSDTETKLTGPTKRQQKAANTKIQGQKLELKQLLTQPLLAQGISKRYITSGSNPIVHELLAGESESTPCRGDQICA